MRVLAQRATGLFRETLQHAAASKNSHSARYKATRARRMHHAGDIRRIPTAQLRALDGCTHAWRSDHARAEPLARFARRSLDRLHAKL